MATELPKQYDPREAQQRWLAFWEFRTMAVKYDTKLQDAAEKAAKHELGYQPDTTTVPESIKTKQEEGQELTAPEKATLDAAAAFLNESLRLEPRSGETYARLGELASARGDRERAVQLFRRALELHPENKRAAAALAGLHGTTQAK